MSVSLPRDVELMDGLGALPRNNGELRFAAPWEGRALALAVALVERLALPWNAFRQHLIDAINDAPERPYYESWAAALESLVIDLGLTTPSRLDAVTLTERAPL